MTTLLRGTPDDAELQRRGERLGEIMMTLPPEMPNITRIVVATDMEHGERVMAAFEAGEITAQQAVAYSGSYFRLTVATTLWGQGHLTDDWFFESWPDLWRGSDPDDTDPKYWDIWQTAFALNNGRIYDLPKVELPGKGALVKVYRGQMPGDPIGCSWTTDRKVAQSFAKGAGFRTEVNGRVLHCSVPRGLILAYLTGRGEAECIIDPRDTGWTTAEEV